MNYRNRFYAACTTYGVNSTDEIEKTCKEILACIPGQAMSHYEDKYEAAYRNIDLFFGNADKSVSKKLNESDDWHKMYLDICPDFGYKDSPEQICNKIVHLIPEQTMKQYENRYEAAYRNLDLFIDKEGQAPANGLEPVEGWDKEFDWLCVSKGVEDFDDKQYIYRSVSKYLPDAIKDRYTNMYKAAYYNSEMYFLQKRNNTFKYIRDICEEYGIQDDGFVERVYTNVKLLASGASLMDWDTYADKVSSYTKFYLDHADDLFADANHYWRITKDTHIKDYKAFVERCSLCGITGEEKVNALVDRIIVWYNGPLPSDKSVNAYWVANTNFDDYMYAMRKIISSTFKEQSQEVSYV